MRSTLASQPRFAAARGRGAADRPDGWRLPARLVRAARRPLLDCFFAVPSRAARRDGGDRDRLRRRVDAGLPRRRGLGRGARARRGPRGGAPPLREHAVAGARPACARARPCRARDDRRSSGSCTRSWRRSSSATRAGGGSTAVGPDRDREFVADARALRDDRLRPPWPSCCRSSPAISPRYRGRRARAARRTSIGGRTVLTTPAALARRRRSSRPRSSGLRTPRRLADRAQALRHGYAVRAAAARLPARRTSP